MKMMFEPGYEAGVQPVGTVTVSQKVKAFYILPDFPVQNKAIKRT